MPDGRPVVALHPGVDRLDTPPLPSTLGAPSVRRATGDEARAATGFAIGGVPPLGHAQPLPVLMDRGLFEHEIVWAAAGLPDAVFSVAPGQLQSAAAAELADLAEGR
jgi:prolyl-tRNA editing enzyme YbaK/EbsC (Cys-tRNA(Pro) deacylase)